MFGFSDGTKGSVGVQIQGEPASLEARIITAVEQIDYPFSLPEIALESHESMPERIEPIQFDGDEPVGFKFVRLSGDKNFRKTVFEVTNHANKSIAHLEIQLLYLDAAGKTLKEMPHSHGGSKAFPEEHAAKELEITAFFMPEGTETVVARLKRIAFVDASVWDRADIFTDEHVPYVIGTAALQLARSERLSAGYVGLDREGKLQSNMAGVSRLAGSRVAEGCKNAAG